MKLIKILFIFTLIITSTSCSYYSLKGTIPSHINNIYIKPILNKSADQEIVNYLNEKINDLLISENVLEIVDYDYADSRIDITILDVLDLPYTLSKGNQAERVDEWKISVKAKVSWLDFKRGETIFDIIITEWGIYGASLDISSDGIDNDGDGLIDSEDSDEIGSPRNSARIIAANKIADKILTKITSTW